MTHAAGQPSAAAQGGDDLVRAVALGNKINGQKWVGILASLPPSAGDRSHLCAAHRLFSQELGAAVQFLFDAQELIAIRDAIRSSDEAYKPSSFLT